MLFVCLCLCLCENLLFFVCVVLVFVSEFACCVCVRVCVLCLCLCENLLVCAFNEQDLECAVVPSPRAHAGGSRALVKLMSVHECMSACVLCLYVV